MLADEETVQQHEAFRYHFVFILHTNEERVGEKSSNNNERHCTEQTANEQV